MPKKTLLFLNLCLGLCVSLGFSLCFAQSTTTISTATLTDSPPNPTTQTINADICTVVNSFNIYNSGNLKKIQNYIKQNFFGKTKITGRYDIQTIYYIKQFQMAYGLTPTGKLDSDTINFLKNKNNCFDLEKQFLNLQNGSTTPPTKNIIASGTLMGVIPIWVDRKSQQEIINDLLDLLK